MFVGECTDGKLQIRGYPRVGLGRLEVCVNGTWSTVCKDGWDDIDARVACHQLGFSIFGKGPIVHVYYTVTII